MYELIEKKKLFKLLGKGSQVLLRPKNLLISSVIIGLINILIVINQGFFGLRFPYMLVEGTPPIGFLGGKGYTDHPYIYQYKKFPEKKQKINEQDTSKTLNIFLEGNSITRDLINALEIIDEMSPNLKFNYSYNYPETRKLNKDLLDKADLLIIQIDNFELTKKTTLKAINDKILLEEYGDYFDKILWHKTREQFAKNITPIMFLKNQEERSNFKYQSIDSYSCKKEDILSEKSLPFNSGLGIIDTQCAFNDSEGLKILTSSRGELFTFDGQHLTLAGATDLARNLLSSKAFKKILGL